MSERGDERPPLCLAANRHICRFAPNATKKVIIPLPAGLALRTTRALRHVIGPRVRRCRPLEARLP